MQKVFDPLKAIRKNCLDCSQSSKYVMWCPCDGVHSTRCHLWPYRFGVRPATARKRYGEQVMNPNLMPDANVCLDNLPERPNRIPVSPQLASPASAVSALN
jgi:hypothetical protein